MAGWTRERVKVFVERRYSTRWHMSLILTGCLLMAMVANSTLLHLGAHSMLTRYPIAVGVSYLTFLFGVWLWLRLTGAIKSDARERRRGSDANLDAADITDIPLPRGGGGVTRAALDGMGRSGTFDGGGASAAWGNPGGRADLGSQVGGTVGKGIEIGGFDIDGEGFVLLLLGALLFLVILATSGYLIYCAPDILTEAAFGALLAGGLAKPKRGEDTPCWMAGVIKGTWWPFALVLLIAVGVAGYCAKHYPQAKTFREAVHLAIHS